jgi:isocitrate dehydrogenase kinase/phosphatase
MHELWVIVSYLQTVLPGKKKWEVFWSFGLYKHGKTEFFRALSKNLDQSDDLFRLSEGIKGQVMMVFKVIKNKPPATKSVTREEVRASYQLVKTHDRVGRMADTQEYLQGWNFSFLNCERTGLIQTW